MDRRRWAAVRARVFERDGYRCRLCKRPGRLECDHVIPMHRRPDGADPYDLDGLQTLCRGCHLRKTRRENEARAAERFPAAAKWKAALEELM